MDLSLSYNPLYPFLQSNYSPTRLKKTHNAQIFSSNLIPVNLIRRLGLSSAASFFVVSILTLSFCLLEASQFVFFISLFIQVPDKCVFCIISSLFYTISHHLSSLYIFRIGLHACCIFVFISGDLEEGDLIMSNHSTTWLSRGFKISRDHSTTWSSRGLLDFITSLDPEVECLHPHHIPIP